MRCTFSKSTKRGASGGTSGGGINQHSQLANSYLLPLSFALGILSVMMPKLWYRCDNWVNTVWENDLPSGAFATTLTWDSLVPRHPVSGSSGDNPAVPIRSRYLRGPARIGCGLGLPDAITVAIRQKYGIRYRPQSQDRLGRFTVPNRHILFRVL